MTIASREAAANGKHDHKEQCDFAPGLN